LSSYFVMGGPSIIAGISFAGLLAALMSTMDTAMNTGPLVLTEDFYHRVINPKASEKQIILFARISVTIMALMGVFVALQIRDLLWVLWMASDILAAGVFWPLVLGMYTKWGTNQGAIASMVVGSGYVLWHYLIDLGMKLRGISLITIETASGGTSRVEATTLVTSFINAFFCSSVFPANVSMEI